MLSLPKIIALAGVVWLVFYLFRMMDSRRRNMNDAPRQNPRQNPHDNDAENRASGTPPPDSLDLEECVQCGAWVTGRACDRAECPYRS